MTLRCFYSRLKSECKEKRHAASSYNILMRRRRAIRWLLGATELTVWSNTIHTHTGKPHLPKMQIQFSRQGKRVNTYSDLCKPQLSVSPPANRLVLCDRVNSCSGVEARRPGRSTLPICCSDSLAVSPNSARNLMSILLPSVCTALPFDSRLWKTFSELSPPKNTLLHLPNTYSDFRL